VGQLFINLKKANDSVRREVLCNILIQFGVPMKLVSLIEVCMSETYSRVYLFPIRNGLKKGDAVFSLVFNFALEYALGGFG